MSVEYRHFVSDLLCRRATNDVRFAIADFERVEQHCNEWCSQLVDIHCGHGVRIYYLRVTSEDASKKIRISSDETVDYVSECSEYGVLLRNSNEEGKYTIWFPPGVGQFCFDKHERISSFQKSLVSYEWEFRPHIQLSVSQSCSSGSVTVVPYVVFEDAYGEFFEELTSLSEIERHLYRKSDWFYARRPSDLWNYLINGSIYDPRSDKIIAKRFKCQQCAYAWWNYFDFLHKQTGKKVYTVMQDEVAFSVLLDMSADGEWGHGFWSDEIETHARFHLDGLHLLISQYEKTSDPVWLEAVERGMAFVSEHLTERLDDGGFWFLHDTIEHMGPHHFKSTLFGKTPGNSLCINTHVQALTVLNRLLCAIPDNKIYAEMFDKGCRTLRRALDHQPAELLYKALIFWIVKHKTRNEGHSIWGKLKKSLEKRLLPRIYWSVMRQFPRLIQPGGFTERDLTRSFASDRYHVTNLKDLLTLYQQEPFVWLRPYIVAGTAFVRKFVRALDVATAVASSPYYIELIDILYLYDKLIEPLPSEEINTVERKIYQQTHGYSLDYYASALVRGR